ncbi:conserved hypothetical protein [Verrucomicrobiia bacterium DG1235]|nr:conserved hypothetical protein [Verrucomicrobiae bacterium DG1235]
MAEKSGEQLCLACGLCCDGSLFDNVRFGPGDDVEGAKARGLPVKVSRAKVPVAFVRQPCSALCGDLKCRIYAERPSHCRSFECGVFKESQSGQITLEAALRQVKRGRRKAEKVRELLRKFGDTDERSSIGVRFRRAQRRVESGLVDGAAGDVFADLGLAMHELDMLAHRRFYTREDNS